MLSARPIYLAPRSEVSRRSAAGVDHGVLDAPRACPLQRRGAVPTGAPDAAARAVYTSRSWRTLRASASGVKGFSSNSNPGSRSPCRPMTPSV